MAALKLRHEAYRETDHEKAQYAWNYRWSDVVDRSPVLGPMVVREERGAIT